MKMICKILAILCAAAMLFALAACGRTTNTTPVTTSEPTIAPDGEAAVASGDASAPEKPDGETGSKPDGEPGEKPDGEPPEKPDGQPGGAPGGGFGGSSEVTHGSSANTITEDGTYSGTAYTSTGDDENALRVDGAAVTLDGVTVDKSAGATSNTVIGVFYGF